MNKEELSLALDELDDDIIERTARLRAKGAGRARNSAACAAALVFAAALAAVSIVIAGRSGDMKQANSDNSPAQAQEAATEATPPTGDPSGVYLPPGEVDLSLESGEKAEMIPFFIYGGRFYEQLDDSWQNCIKREYLGEKLGTATGLIDEWTPADGYVELAGSVRGDFYAVNGYDPGFLLALRFPDGDEYLPFVCVRGLTYEYGRELYRDMLRVPDRLCGVTYESFVSWYYSRGELCRLPVDAPELTALIEAAYDGVFTNIEEAQKALGINEFSVPNLYGRCLYCLHLEMEPGFSVKVDLMEGGWLLIREMRPLILKADDARFNDLIALMERREGEKVNDPSPFETRYAECVSDGTLGRFIPSFVPEGFYPASAEIMYDDKTGKAYFISLDYLISMGDRARYYISVSESRPAEGPCVLTPDTLSVEALEGLIKHISAGEFEYASIYAVLELDGASVLLIGTDIEAETAYRILSSAI